MYFWSVDAFVIICDEKYAGYAVTAKTFSAEAGGRVVWYEELYIRSEFRQRGLGSEFFNYAEKLYADYARIRLEVEADNSGAIRLYKRLGFTELPYMQMVKDKAKLL